jgi:hypothetical protein
VYDENSVQGLAEAGALLVAPAGPAGTTVAGAANFNTQLTTNGPWDVVAIDCPSSIPTGGWDDVIDYANAGGSVVMSFWDWDNSGGQGDPGLPGAFGLDGTISKIDLIDGVTNYFGLATAIDMGLFNGVDTSNDDWVDNWADDGDNFDLGSGATAIGAIGFGVVHSRRNNGNAIAVFVLDEAGPTWAADARNLWRNMILNVAKSTCPKDVVFDGSPGTAAPPSTLGPYQITDFPLNSPCPPAMVSSIGTPLPGSGVLQFSSSLEHFSVTGGAASACSTWATWSHGYTGDVYFRDGNSVTLTMPPNTGAFQMYVEPNSFSVFDFTAVSNGGTTSGTVAIDGDGGAKYFGFYAAGGVLHSITITNTDGNAGGFAVGEFGIAQAGQIIFNGAPGTAAPPATLGPYVMNPFPLLACAGDVDSIPTPAGGSINFSETLTHRRIDGVLPCGFWATWSHGYTGDVYATPLDSSSDELTLFPPNGTGALYFYVEPNNFGLFSFTVTTNDGSATSGADMIEGDSGAEYFGFYALGGGEILSVTITNAGGTADGFAVGEFGIADTFCGPTCLADLNADGIVNGFDLAILLGQWTGAAQYAPCPPRKQADLNGDCRINGFDLATLLGLWGPC